MQRRESHDQTYALKYPITPEAITQRGALTCIIRRAPADDAEAILARK